MVSSTSSSGVKCLASLGGVDLAAAPPVAVASVLACCCLVLVADLFPEQLAIIGVLMPQRAFNAVQRGGDLEPMAHTEADELGDRECLTIQADYRTNLLAILFAMFRKK